MKRTEVIGDWLTQAGIFFAKDVSLRSKTWVKRGGTTKFWVVPTTKEQLAEFAKFCFSSSIPFEVIGSSSNCYFAESYHPLVVISMLKVSEIEFRDNLIVCDAGAPLIKVARRCVETGIPGFEGFIGLPGTVGGAAINNAGSYGSLTENVIDSIVIADESGCVKTLTRKEMRYSERSSVIKRKEIRACVLQVNYRRGDAVNPDTLRVKAERFANDRKTYQENRYRNLGSIFPTKQLGAGIRHNWISVLMVALPFRIAKLFIQDRLRRQYIHKKLFFLFDPSIGQNVSERSFNCFVWNRDDLGDEDFFRYLRFMRARAKERCFPEIEVKGDVRIW